MPQLKLTPKELQILRRFQTPTSGINWKHEVVQILKAHGFIQAVPVPGGASSGELTPDGIAYLAAHVNEV